MTLDLKNEFIGKGIVKIKNDKKYIEMQIPDYFEGHYWAVDIIERPKNTIKIDDGRTYRIEFTIFNEFALFKSSIDLEQLNFDDGISDVKIVNNSGMRLKIHLNYFDVVPGKDFLEFLGSSLVGRLGPELEQIGF